MENVIDGPRYAVISDGVLVHRSESSGLVLTAIADEIKCGEFLEVKIVNVRLIQQVHGFISEQLEYELEEWIA